MGKDEIRQKVDELARLTQQQTETKNRIDQLKAWFETAAVDTLKDTKLKTVEYWGSNQCKVTVNSSETVKPASLKMVKPVFGEIYTDYIKEESAYKMTEPCKRLFAMVFMGNYTEGSLDETVKAITGDKKIQQALRKKLKGKYAKDTECLMKIAGLSGQEASDWAYLIAEIINWEWLLQILKAADWKGSIQEAVDMIKAAVIVEEGLKVTVDIEP